MHRVTTVLALALATAAVPATASAAPPPLGRREAGELRQLRGLGGHVRRLPGLGVPPDPLTGRHARLQRREDAWPEQPGRDLDGLRDRLREGLTALRPDARRGRLVQGWTKSPTSRSKSKLPVQVPPPGAQPTAAVSVYRGLRQGDQDCRAIASAAN